MLCEISDVIRVLRLPGTPALEEQLSPLLQGVDEWVHMAYDIGFDLNAPNAAVTETFYNVRQDQLITLQDYNPSNVSIQVYPENDSDFIADLFDNSSQFDVQPNGKLRLTASIFVTIPAFPQVWSKRFLRTFHKVVVTYTASGFVPYGVREAVALICAATYVQQPVDVSNIKSEHIGDYSYTIESTFRGGNTPFVIPPRAQKFLQPYTRGLFARAV